MFVGVLTGLYNRLVFANTGGVLSSNLAGTVARFLLFFFFFECDLRKLSLLDKGGSGYDLYDGTSHFG